MNEAEKVNEDGWHILDCPFCLRTIHFQLKPKLVMHQVWDIWHGDWYTCSEPVFQNHKDAGNLVRIVQGSEQVFNSPETPSSSAP